MLLKFLLMVMIVLVIGVCTYFKYSERYFDKPLINLPIDNEGNVQTKDTKPAHQQMWVEAKTSRLWVSPHVDENGDYVEGYYKYIVLEPGHWSLNGNQANSR
jgi:hypothetical protein